MSDASKARSGNTWPASGGASGDRSQGQGSNATGMADTAKQAKDRMADTAKEAEGAVKETAHEAMDTARQTVTEMADQTQQQASEMISQVSEQVTDTIGDVRQQATTAYTEQRDRAVSSLGALADALREAGRTLESNRQGVSAQDQPAAALAPFIEEAADRLAQSADFLKNKEIGGLLDDAQRLARKQPGLFVASMFGIGLVGARLLKGAMSDDGAPSGQQGQQGWQGGGSQTGSGSGESWQRNSQGWGQGATESMPSGLGGSSIESTQSGSSASAGFRDATRGESANALTGQGPFDQAGPGTTTYAPADSARTGYEHARPADTRSGSGSGTGSGSGNRAQETATPGAGWVVDDANRAGDTVDTASRPGQSVNTDARLHDHPGGGEGTTGMTGTTGEGTGGSAMTGYGAFDADSFADRDRADAVTGGDHTRFVGRNEEGRS